MGGAGMGAVRKAMSGAARSLVHPIILAILLVPMLVALAIWIGVGWTYLDAWTSGIQTTVLDHASFSWLANWDVSRLAVCLPLVLSAYLHQRLFRYDALSDHADAQG